MTELAVLEGVISIEAALRANSRDISKICLRQGKRSRDSARLVRLAQQQGVALEEVPEAELEDYVNGKSHGGVVAFVGSRRFQPLASLVKNQANPFIIMLDGIEDPFNFGYAVRAFYAAGAAGLVVRPRNWLTAAGVVARASAGASERIPMAVADTAEEAATLFREYGLIIAGTAKTNAVSIYETNLAIPLFLVVGGEKRGLTRSFRDTVDIALQIPYGRPFDQSLGTTAAAAALAFEVMRQRQG